MPELPEVETVRKGLESALKGKRIEEVLLRRKTLRVPITPGLARRVEGRRIERIGRRGKYLLFHLDGGQSILAHLGMSGRMVVRPSLPKRFEKHDHVVMMLGGGGAFVFNDARRFGVFLLTEAKKLTSHPLLVSMGPDPFDETFDADALARALEKRKGPIKTALMDQTLVAGIGNIYASEILFAARVRPTCPACRCIASANRMVNSAHKVLRDAIRSGGSTLRDYVRPTGDPGWFQHRFAVYGRAGEACGKCASTIRRIVQSGRATYYCPRCQK